MEEKNTQQTGRDPMPANDSGADAPVPQPRKKFPTAGDAFAMLGIMLGAQIAVGVVGMIVMAIMGQSAAVEDPAVKGRLMFVLYLVTMSVALFGILRYRRGRGDTGPVARFSSRGLNPVLLVWAFVLMIAAGVVLEPVVSLLPDPPYDGMGRGLWTVLSLVVLAPLFEEVICRGVVLGALRRKYGVTTALLASSLFFGVIHLYPAQVIGASVLGLVLGFIYIATDSLWAAIILHAANNGVAYVLMTAYGDADLAQIVEGRTLYVLIYIAALALTAVSGYMVWRSLKRMSESEKNPSGA